MATQQTKFQKWLFKYLEDNDLTNCAFAEMVLVNDSLIGHYLRGTRHPGYATLAKIANVTGADPRDWF